MTFLKGYQWPFDPAKIKGSSRIDLLVKAQTDLGRRVFLDYRQNPAGYDENLMDAETHNHLAQCGALQATPIERLKSINAPAIELYRSHHIDLSRNPLEVRVCAQHHNGGIGVDSNWQTDIPGLYACGEAAGTFGQYRPGGTALNSTQVGSQRAAQHIARTARPIPSSLPPIQPPLLPEGDPATLTAELQKEMSRCAAFVRNAAGIRQLLNRLREIEQHCSPAQVDDQCLEKRIRLRDLITTQKQVLNAMLFDMETPGSGVLETKNEESSRRPARPIPDRDLWFERVWQKNLDSSLK